MAEPGFNSGSDKIFGIWKVDDVGKKMKIDGKKDEYVTVVGNNPDDLVYFNGKGHHRPPEVTWDKSELQLPCYFLIQTKWVLTIKMICYWVCRGWSSIPFQSK